MDLVGRLGGSHDGAILAEARRGDTVTVAAFKDALNGVLPSSVRDLVERQYLEVRSSHDDLERSRVVGA